MRAVRIEFVTFYHTITSNPAPNHSHTSLTWSFAVTIKIARVELIST